MFEAVPVVDLIDTREIIQSLDSDPVFVRVHGSSDGELGSTSQIRGKKSSDANLVCNFPHVEYEKLGLWTQFTYRTENKLLFISQ